MGNPLVCHHQVVLIFSHRCGNICHLMRLPCCRFPSILKHGYDSCRFPKFCAEPTKFLHSQRTQLVCDCHSRASPIFLIHQNGIPCHIVAMTIPKHFLHVPTAKIRILTTLAVCKPLFRSISPDCPAMARRLGVGYAYLRGLTCHWKSQRPQLSMVM